MAGGEKQGHKEVTQVVDDLAHFNTIGRQNAKLLDTKETCTQKH